MTKNVALLLLICTALVSTITAQSLPAYQLFTAKGKKTDFGSLVKQAKKADIILFGEYHNNPICHWIQWELTDVLRQSGRLIAGAEMIETDNQEVLNSYLSGEIDQKSLDTLARLWNNHKTDYKPLVDLAKTYEFPFIATNIPRKYASKVFREGLESLEALPDEEKRWIAPLPITYYPELPGYKNMLTMMGDHASENFPKAQAIKDATMANSILKNYIQGYRFIHYHGTYHSDNYEGILWYLKTENPDLKYLTISTVSQKDLKKLEKEHLQKADFILVVDDNMTTTY